jgi:predicted metalloprotease
MPFGDSGVDIGGVDDRRGRGLGAPLALGGGGLGLGGLVLYLLISLLGGGSSFVPSNAAMRGTGETTEQLRQRCNTDGAIDRYDDCYVIKSYNEVNDVWDGLVKDYSPPTLVFFGQATQTACGTASAEVGPFYCPGDRSVYIDLGFLAQLQQEFGAQGRYAQTYIVAHEIGHHVQTLTGTEGAVRRLQQQQPDEQQELSIGLELQADCYAGVWSKRSDHSGDYVLTDQELDQALNAASAVGDDRIQQKVQGRVDPETWTHGSAEQRRNAFLRGFQSGDANQCDQVPGGR